MKRQITPVPGGAALCQRMYTRIGCAGPPPAFRVEFYPYASLVLTVRRRDEQMIVRFSDLLQRAPLPVLEGAAALLLSKIYRRRTRRALVAPYQAYAKSHKTRERIQEMRRGRVRPVALDAVGRQFDLNGMFDELNTRFFAGVLEKPHLGWSMRGWRRQFGPGGSPAVRRGVCFVSRDAAREAPDAKVRVQSAVALAGISRGGEIVSGIREGAEGLGRAGTEEISIKFQAVRKLASGLRF